MALKNYHRIIAETPPEIKKLVQDWMDEQDRLHGVVVQRISIWGREPQDSGSNPDDSTYEMQE